MTEDTLGKIGKYELVELIGEGAMGKVYRALDPVLGRNVAIKLMSASIANDAHLRDRFLREARAAANLQHPNIITIYDFGETEGHPYIAMEFVEGTDLAHLIEQREPLSLDSKVGLVIGLLHGLGYAHLKGVVHRDVKPANIRVTPDGRVKIMDFGIAHLQGSEITHSGAVLGTPDYMAPEQVRGLPVTAATDIFAAGAVLYELLTYEKPFVGESLHAVLFKVVTENPRAIRDINTSLPENLQRVVDTAMNKEPGRRYPTADAMAADLSTARTSLTDLETVATLRFARPLNLGLPAREWWRRKSMRYAVGSTAAIALLGLGWMALIRLNEATPRATAAPAAVPDTVVTPTLVPPAGADSGTAVVAVADSAPKSEPRAVSPPRRPAPPPAGAGQVNLKARLELEREVMRLERAISTGRTSQIRLIMPGLSDAAAKGWDDFFRNKRELRATLALRDVELMGKTAVARLDFAYTYIDKKSGEQESRDGLKLTAVLERGAAGWVWTDFKYD